MGPDGSILGLLAIGSNGWGDELIRGAFGTAALAATTLPIGLAGGLLLALAKASSEASWRIFGRLVTTVLRGLPELLTLLLVFILGQVLLRRVGEWTGFGEVDLSSFTAGVIALAIVFAAYSSEVFLGALRALDRGLLEAAHALALSRRITFTKIVMPELFRLSLPGLSNQWLSMLKQTSLVSALSYTELTQQGSIAAAGSRSYLFFYLVIFFSYFALSFSSELAYRRLNRHFARGRHL